MVKSVFVWVSSLFVDLGLGFNFLWIQVIKSDSAVFCYLKFLFFEYCQKVILSQDISDQIWVLCSPGFVGFLT